MTAVISLESPVIDAALLSRRETVILYFGAPWCGPCRSMSPMLAGIAEEHAEKILLVKINIDEHSDLVTSEGISSVPVVKIYREGAPTQTLLGAVMRDEMLRALGV